jgi:hypothetical protein
MMGIPMRGSYTYGFYNPQSQRKLFTSDHFLWGDNTKRLTNGDQPRSVMKFLMQLSLLMGVTYLATGCTSVVSSNPRQVIVESQMMNAPKAQQLAESECAKQKRYAVMTGKADYWERNYIFSCVD